MAMVESSSTDEEMPTYVSHIKQRPLRPRRPRIQRIVPCQDYQIYYSTSDLESQIGSDDEDSDMEYFSLPGDRHLYINRQYEQHYENKNAQNGSSNGSSHRGGIRRQASIDIESPRPGCARRVLPEICQKVLARPSKPSSTPKPAGNVGDRCPERRARLLPKAPQPLANTTDAAPVERQPSRMNKKYAPGSMLCVDPAVEGQGSGMPSTSHPQVQGRINMPAEPHHIMLVPMHIASHPRAVKRYFNSMFHLCHHVGCIGTTHYQWC